MTMRSSLVIIAALVLALSGPVPGEAAGRGGGGHGGGGAHRGGGHSGGGHHGGHGHGHGWHGGCCAFGLGFYGFPYAYPYYPYYPSYAYPYPGYTYPSPAYTYPYPAESYPTYTQNVSVGAPASQPPAVQREVVYPHGKYVLYGDGVTQPWQWVWVPNAPPAPPQ